MSLSSSLDERRILCDRISLKRAVYWAVGFELGLCLIAILSAIYQGFILMFLTQTVEIFVCASVFYAIRKDRPGLLWGYLVYNVADIVYMQLVAYPMAIYYCVTLIYGESSAPVHMSKVNRVHQMENFFFEQLVEETLFAHAYLICCLLSWWVVYTAYREMRNAEQHRHQRLNNTEAGSSYTLDTTALDTDEWEEKI